MGHFVSTYLDTRQNVPRDKDNPYPHELLSGLTFVCDDGATITVKAGFRTDWASIPWFFRRLCPQDGPWNAAAVIHDGLMAAEIFDNHKCALIFRECLEALNVPGEEPNIEPGMIKAMYVAVERFGAETWAGHTMESIQDARGHVEVRLA